MCTEFVPAHVDFSDAGKAHSVHRTADAAMKAVEAICDALVNVDGVLQRAVSDTNAAAGRLMGLRRGTQEQFGTAC